MSDAIKPDLVERLRMDSGHGIQPLCEEAAAAIEALRAERDAALALLREAREWVDAAEHPSYGPYRQAVELCARIDAALAAKEQP